MTLNTIHNKTFCNHERKIEHIVQQAVTAGVINLSVRDLCRDLGISRQTFYVHYDSINDVQKRQESRLQSDFKKRISANANREVLFTLTLNFIKENAWYFSTVLRRQDFKTLTWMIDYMRARLVPKGTSEYSYYQYRSNLTGIIQIWVVSDGCAKQYVPIYVTELVRLRVMRSRLDDRASFPKPSVQTPQIQC